MNSGGRKKEREDRGEEGGREDVGDRDEDGRGKGIFKVFVVSKMEVSVSWTAQHLFWSSLLPDACLCSTGIFYFYFFCAIKNRLNLVNKKSCHLRYTLFFLVNYRYMLVCDNETGTGGSQAKEQTNLIYIYVRS